MRRFACSLGHEKHKCLDPFILPQITEDVSTLATETDIPSYDKSPLLAHASSDAFQAKQLSSFDFFRFQVLLSRSARYFARNIGNAIARMIVSLFLGVFIGLVYNSHNDSDPALAAETHLKVLYFVTLMIVLLPFQTITLFQDTRQYFLRERAAQLYTCLEYFAANMVMEVLLVVVCTLLLIIPAYWLVGLNSSVGCFFFALTEYTILYLTSSTFMTFISNLTPNADLAFALGAFFMSVFFLFSGFFILLPDLPSWLYWINYFT